jgi:hypothetical protein
VAALVEPPSAQLQEAAARLQTAAISTIHAATGRPAPEGRFPQDIAASALPPGVLLLTAGLGPLPSPAHEAWSALVTSLQPLVIGKPSLAVEMDTPWLAYGCDVLLEHLLAKGPSPVVRRAARALGLATRAVQEAEQLWSSNLHDSSRAAPPYLISTLVGSLGGDGTPSTPSAGWSSYFSPWQDDFPLRRQLGAAWVLDALTRSVDEWLEQIRGLAMSESGRRALKSFSHELQERLHRAIAIARLCGWLRDDYTPAHIEAERARTVQIARAGLLEDERLHECWEIQRWGRWCEEPRMGRFFQVGLCLQALATSGADVSARAAALLSLRRVDGWRYYEDWLGIPPDADDLGIALQLIPLAGDGAVPHAAMRVPMDLLQRNTTAEGWIDTYLEDGLCEPPQGDAPYWLGRRCLVVAANAMLGVLHAGWPMPREWMDRVLRCLATSLRQDGLGAVTCYPACYARLVLTRLERALEHVPCAPEARAGFSWAVDGFVEELRSSRQRDGGWGSPLQTACHLAVLALRRADGFDPGPSILYLSSRQEPDGLWAREPLYRGPGRDGMPSLYQSRSVTAALCLEALVLAGKSWPVAG